MSSEGKEICVSYSVEVSLIYNKEVEYNVYRDDKINVVDQL